MAKKEKLSQFNVIEICVQYAQGKTSNALAEKFGVSGSAVLYQLRKNGVPRRNRGSPPQLTKRNITDICVCYQEGASTQDLALKYRVSTGAVIYWLVQKGIPRRSQLKLGMEETYEICKKYSTGMGCVELAREYGVSDMTILRALERAGVAKRGHRKYSLQEDAFDNASRERNYWIGFMMADGCVHYRKKAGVIVELSAALQDYAQLLKFCNFLKTDKPVSFGPRPRGRRQIQCKATAVSKKMAESLAPFGVLPRKSLTAKVKLLEMDLDFWRGVIDGDGSVYVDKRGEPCIVAHGSKPLMRQFHTFALFHFSDFKGSVLKSRTIWRIILGGKTRATKMIQLLYGDCDISLDRKQLVANEIMEKFGT